MKKSLAHSLKSQFSLTKLHGKFYDVQFGDEIIKIKKIYIFQSQHHQYICIETRKYFFLGIILAQQSSDFLALMAKKIIVEKKHLNNLENTLHLIQYLLPMGNHQVKLITFYSWTNQEQTSEFMEKLEKIGEKFKQKMNLILTAVN